MPKNESIKICKKGHEFIKSSSCIVCPICEKSNPPKNIFLSHFSAPARRALENQGIFNIESIQNYTELEMSKLHGIGKTALRTIEEMLKTNKLNYKNG